ncbi:RNA polymerase sigma factor [Pedobacter suwonensis]|uniref:RNA polymerase sigma factor n=1 Tax=Pedobacter suwonensis TaxID=332999 RepID=UPI0036C6386F
MSTVFEDQEILNEISIQNRHVFDKLYRQYYKKLFTISYKYLRREEMAEEVVHDVFIKIWNLAGKIKLSYSLSGYLSRAVVNASLNLLKGDRINTINIELSECDDIESETELNDAEILENQLLALEKAILQLPGQCQKVLLMSKFDKLKQQEIAEQLGISIKTVKNHLTYGYKKLRENLEHVIIIVFFINILYRSFLY